MFLRPNSTSQNTEQKLFKFCFPLSEKENDLRGGKRTSESFVAASNFLSCRQIHCLSFSIQTDFLSTKVNGSKQGNLREISKGQKEIENSKNAGCLCGLVFRLCCSFSFTSSDVIWGLPQPSRFVASPGGSRFV